LDLGSLGLEQLVRPGDVSREFCGVLAQSLAFSNVSLWASSEGRTCMREPAPQCSPLPQRAFPSEAWRTRDGITPRTNASPSDIKKKKTMTNKEHPKYLQIAAIDSKTVISKFGRVFPLPCFDAALGAGVRA
jgi:hypothetical protein